MTVEKRIETPIETPIETRGRGDKDKARAPGKIRALLEDIEPFFHQRPIVYVDVGAHKGDIFREIFDSALRPREAHLIEPNPAAFAALEATVAALEAGRVAQCHNLALAARPDRLRLRDANTMTKVIGPAGAAAAEAQDETSDETAPETPGVAPGIGRVFEIEARPLDALVQGFARPHISILKIDVEGYEAEVFAGAKGLLEAQAIDLIYVEAGIDPANSQQTYYREIEDILRPHGYRMFRIYEQKHEWIEDSPLLRRINIAFLSEAFAARSPYRLSRELLNSRKELQALRRALKDEQAKLDTAAETHASEIAALTRGLEAGQAALAEAQAVARTREAELAQARETAQSELAQAQAAAETRDAEIAALRARAAALAEGQRLRAIEITRLTDLLETTRQAATEKLAQNDKKLQDAARGLVAAQARQKKFQRDFAQLHGYARKLEQKHRALLDSTTWRAMEPLRRVLRLIRRQARPPAFAPRLSASAGKAPPPPAQKPPPRAQDGTSEKQPRTAAPTGQTGTQKTSGELIDLAKKRHFNKLITLEREFAGQSERDQEFFLVNFARILRLNYFSAFSDSASAVDALRDRFGAQSDWIERNAGRRAYVRFVTDSTTALTRTGRYREARVLLDEAIHRLDREPALLRHRAEMCWPYALDQAREDLDECRRRGALPDNRILFRAYAEMLAKTAADEPFTLETTDGAQGELSLIGALVALDQADFPGYRQRVNDFFQEQGLLAPLPETADRFDFATLATSTERDAAGPLVSVIITTYNSAQTVAYSVASILGQTHSNLEILIVDDRSSDGTADILADLQSADPRIRMLRNESNVGTYLSKNRAMERASGAYVTFHDSDDWAHPERIARHLRLMEEHPSLVASRSEWLRVAEDGRVQFRRWGYKFRHANPASMFLRRRVIDEIGFFDGVRFGADSEYWFRLQRRFGRAQIKSLPLCLGLGRFHTQSLTQSGSGAMDEENYSPIRGAYAASYMIWHATADTTALKRAADPVDRAFWAPPEMLGEPAQKNPRSESGTPTPRAPAAPALAVAGAKPGTAGSTPEFMFGISLASKRASVDWARTGELLGHTLRSLLDQSDGRFIAAIGGHERPDLPELDDPRILFIPCDTPPPANSSGFRKDKMRKRRLVAAALRARGGGYFFPLDADDLVHREVVAHTLADDNRKGYLIDRGYALDYANRILAPIPGAWGVPFDRVCGSSAVIYFRPDELPSDGELESSLYFNLFQSHAYWPIVAEESGRGFAPFPFAGGVYVVNHAQNLSFQLQRAGTRTDNIIQAIARHAIGDPGAVLGGDFGWKAPETGPRARKKIA